MKKTTSVAVEIRHVSKIYQIHHQKPTLSENILHGFKKQKFTALRDINIRIFQGERIGILGSNGSGKTTLLKIIAGIATPSKGTVKTHGKIISLIDLESGFHPDMSGMENIYLNGLVIGMTKQEIKKKIKEIVTFADIGSFINAPLYTYSQGMKLRLGFAIAVHANPDILVLDEGVAAGDQDFQEKSIDRIHEFFKEKKTIIIVSHWLEYLEKNVDKIYLINKGKITYEGTAKKAIKKYLSHN